MAKLPETEITNACIAWIKSMGGDAFHVHGSALQRSAEPDISGEYPLLTGEWLHLKVEVKVAGQNATPLQKVRLDKYDRMGYTVGVVHSVDELKELINHASDNQSANKRYSG